MDEKLKELKARTAGATDRDSLNPDRFYRRTRYEAQRADWNEQTKQLSPWTYHGPYVPESAERI